MDKTAKILLMSLLLLLLHVGAATAQVSGLNVGYVDGRYKGTGTTGFSSTAKNTWISGTIYLPAAKLNVYAGNHIDSINAALASRLNIDSLRVWVRTSLDGSDLAYGAISGKTGSTPRAAKGWNRIALNQHYTIKHGEGLYIGYSFLQKSTSVGLSIINNPQPNALFVKMGTDSTWKDCSDRGALAVEALVYGEHLPKYNLALQSISAPNMYIVDRGNMEITALVKNIATATINGFDMQCGFDGTDKTVTAHINEQLAYNESKYVTFTVSPSDIITNDVPAKRQVTVTLCNLVDGSDEDMNDNVQADSFNVAMHDYERHVLFEEFTTEQCPNCPRVAKQLAKALESNELKGKAHALCHHSGYYTDWLTLPADNDYLWFYNMGGQTFAPALLVDRATRDYISNQTETSPIFMPASGSTEAGAENIISVAKQRMKEPAFVNLNIKAYLDSASDNYVHVKVSGERVRENFTVNPARINVFLYEDSIDDRNQASADADFMHMHVERAYNSVWGDIQEWNGNSYEYTCDLPLRSDYVRNHLGIVAFIWDYDSSSVPKCEVANSNAIDWDAVTINPTDAISSTPNDKRLDRKQYFTVNGVELQKAPDKGLYIIRQGARVIKCIAK